MRRIILLAVVATITALLPLTAAAANDDGEQVYLALGDSVASGFQAPDPFTDDGYVDVLYQRIRGPLGLDGLVNLSCPGDDTAEMIDGNDETLSPGGSLCYGSSAALGNLGGDSQLEAAEAYLAANPGGVALITITIGANDILGCGEDLTCIGQTLGSRIPTNLAQILTRLRVAAPGVPIVAMNYYNPNLAFFFGPNGETAVEQSNQLTAAGNSVLAGVYGAFGVPVADVASAFRIYDDRGGPLPLNVRFNCLYTGMCDRVGGALTISATPDIHPSDLGYRRIAWAFHRTLEAEGIL